jgi:hypothetical protein
LVTSRYGKVVVASARFPLHAPFHTGRQGTLPLHILRQDTINPW